jgi:glycosyl transferase family 25
MPTFQLDILSLPSSTQRRERMAAMLDDAGIENWRFFDAVPPEECLLPYDEGAAFKAYGSTLSRAEISCAASHIGIIERFVREGGADYLVVFEDDIVIDPTLNIAGYLQIMQLAGIEYMKMYARFFVPARFITSFNRFVLYRFLFPPLGTQAYILSRKGARAMLDGFVRHGSIDMPIDQLMDCHERAVLPIYTIYPFQVMELNVPTTIHDAANVESKEARNRMLMASGPSAPRRFELLEKFVRKYRNMRMERIDRQTRDAVKQMLLEPGTIRL